MVRLFKLLDSKFKRATSPFFLKNTLLVAHGGTEYSSTSVLMSFCTTCSSNFSSLSDCSRKGSHTSYKSGFRTITCFTFCSVRPLQLPPGFLLAACINARASLILHVNSSSSNDQNASSILLFSVTACTFPFPLLVFYDFLS